MAFTGLTYKLNIPQANVTIRKKRLTLFTLKKRIGLNVSFGKSRAQAFSIIYRIFKSIFKGINI